MKSAMLHRTPSIPKETNLGLDVTHSNTTNLDRYMHICTHSVLYYFFMKHRKSYIIIILLLRSSRTNTGRGGSPATDTVECSIHIAARATPPARPSKSALRFGKSTPFLLFFSPHVRATRRPHLGAPHTHSPRPRPRRRAAPLRPCAAVVALDPPPPSGIHCRRAAAKKVRFLSLAVLPANSKRKLGESAVAFSPRCAVSSPPPPPADDDAAAAEFLLLLLLSLPRRAVPRSSTPRDGASSWGHQRYSMLDYSRVLGASCLFLLSKGYLKLQPWSTLFNSTEKCVYCLLYFYILSISLTDILFFTNQYILRRDWE